MTIEEFNAALDRVKLSKKEFAAKAGADHRAVYNWSNEGRGVPYWVPSWLKLYEENGDCKRFREMLKESGLCE